MKATTLLVFAVSVAVCTVAATHRFHDSAHTIGTIKADGGKARHPILLDKGRDSYTLIATATVIPPYRGDVRVAVEGEPAMTYEIYNNDPVIDLNPYHKPGFRDNTLTNLRPRDKVALWVVMKPKQDQGAAGGAAAGMKGGDDCCPLGAPSAESREQSTAAADGADATAQRSERGGATGGGRAGSPWRGKGGGAKQFLAFYDTKSNQAVLKVPIIYREKGVAGNAEEH